LIINNVVIKTFSVENYNKNMAQYPSEDGEFDWITGMCIALALALFTGFVLLLIWCTKQEQKARQEMRPPSLAEKWERHNQSKI